MVESPYTNFASGSKYLTNGNARTSRPRSANNYGIRPQNYAGGSFMQPSMLGGGIPNSINVGENSYIRVPAAPQPTYYTDQSVLLN